MRAALAALVDFSRNNHKKDRKGYTKDTSLRRGKRHRNKQSYACMVLTTSSNMEGIRVSAKSSQSKSHKDYFPNKQQFSIWAADAAPY